MMEIRIDYCNPPIPTRKMDWCAHFPNDEGKGPSGFGPTRLDALQDLFEGTETDEQFDAVAKALASERGE